MVAVHDGLRVEGGVVVGDPRRSAHRREPEEAPPSNGRERVESRNSRGCSREETSSSFEGEIGDVWRSVEQAWNTEKVMSLSLSGYGHRRRVALRGDASSAR